MKYTFACKDIGMDCGFKAEAKSKEELLPKIAAHAKEQHNMDPIPQDVMDKVNAAIKEKKGLF
jgi:predicted small metal-binding protein